MSAWVSHVCADLAPQIVFKAHEAEVHAVAFSPDGRTLASGGEVAFVDGGHKLFCRTGDYQFSTLNLDGPRGMQMSGYNYRMRLVTSSPDGKYLAGVSLWEEGFGDKPIVHLHEIATGKEVADFSGISSMGVGFALHFSADGKTIAANSGKTVLLWTVPQF